MEIALPDRCPEKTRVATERKECHREGNTCNLQCQQQQLVAITCFVSLASSNSSNNSSSSSRRSSPPPLMLIRFLGILRTFFQSRTDTAQMQLAHTHTHSSKYDPSQPCRELCLLLLLLLADAAAAASAAAGTAAAGATTCLLLVRYQ